MKDIKRKNKVKGYKFSVIFLLIMFSGLLCGVLFSGSGTYDYNLVGIFSYKVYSSDFISCLIYSLLPIFIYLIFGFFCAASVFGFILLPCECFFIGFVLAYSSFEAYLIIGSKVYALYLLFWALHTAFLIEYIRSCFKSSIEFFSAFTSNKKAEELKLIFKDNIKNFYSAMLVSAIYTFLLVLFGLGINKII